MTANQGVLKSIPLSDIKIKKNFNDRGKEHFKVGELKELTNSIKRHGIIQPVLIQKKGKENWLIAGHRRIASAKLVAKKNGGDKKYKVPAKVLSISDQEALELMMVENLQRKDLSPLEEAKGFAKYLKKFPKVKDLADRCNKPVAYINKRVAVLNLPAEILEDWNNGGLSFGHLEQFIRVSPEDAMVMFTDILNRRTSWHQSTNVSALANWVERSMLYIKNAVFDIKKAGCTKCHYNSSVQKSLFAQDAEKLQCSNQTCFMEKQKEAIHDNWPMLKKSKRLKTTGMVIRDSNINWSDFNIFHKGDPVSSMCEQCEHHKTLVAIDGEIDYARTCFGDEKCYDGAKACVANGKTNAVKKKDVKSQAEIVQAEKIKKRAKTITKIGIETRELHYENAIPEKIAQVKPQDDKALKLALIALIHSKADLHKPFAEHFNIETGEYYYRMDADKIAHLAQHLDMATIKNMLRDFSNEVFMSKDFSPSGRDKIADFVGVNFEKEWSMDKAYLKRRQKQELIDLITDKKFGLYKQRDIANYVVNKLGKTMDTLDSVKKSDLLDVLLESGADLSGIVPDEVQNPA